MRVIMTGTRDFRDAELVQKAVKRIVGDCPEGEPLVICHFATNMVDGHIDAVCKLAGINVKEVAPDWRSDGKAALYRLVEKSVPGSDRVIVFGNDAVMAHAITVANANGVPVSQVVPQQVVEALAL